MSRSSSPVSYSCQVTPSTPGAAFPVQRVKAFPEQSDGQVVEQGGELHLLVFPCCFPHARQTLGHALPALCRVRVRLASVLLDQRSSLLTLRRRSFVLVRMTHRYPRLAYRRVPAQHETPNCRAYLVCIPPSCSPLLACVSPLCVGAVVRLSTAIRADLLPYPRGPRSGPDFAVPVHPHLIGPIRPTRGHIPTSPTCGS